MCRATAVVYSDGVKGVSATGIVPRNWRANASVPFAMKAMRLVSSMGRFWAHVLQELSFILDDFVNFLDAKTESLDCLVEDAALFLRVWFLVCLTDKGGMSRFTLFVFA